MIKLKIDNREPKLNHILTIEGVSIIFENLQYADYIFEIDDVPLLFIERKTINDLASSIKDSRFLNQKNALMLNVNRKMIYYVIEGDMNFQESSLMNSGISITALQSCILNSMIRDDIKVIMTKNFDDTIALIRAIAIRLVKYPEKYSCGEISVLNEPVITKYKASMLGKDKFFENVLMQVPGISVKTAKVIIAKFESLDNLYKTMIELTKEEKTNILSTIYTQDSKGKNRKISILVVNNIINYIF